MPQPCSTATPYSSRNASISSGGAAEPPVMMRFTVASFSPLARRCCSRPSQTVGTPQVKVTRSWLSRSRQAGAVEVPARQHQRRAGQRGGVRNAPGVDVEHRHDRQHAAGGAQVQHVGQRDRIGVQHGGAVAVQHALRPPGGARGVAERAGGVLVERRPGVVVVRRLHQRVVAEQAHARRQRRPPACRPRRSASPRRARVRDLRRRCRRSAAAKLRIDEQHAVAGVVDDVGDVVRVQPRIDGVADRLHAGVGVVDLQMPVARSTRACRPGPAASTPRPCSTRTSRRARRSVVAPGARGACRHRRSPTPPRRRRGAAPHAQAATRSAAAAVCINPSMTCLHRAAWVFLPRFPGKYASPGLGG